ncbi:MAG: hypothetical protein HYW23_01830 [Candidatus Aenigmarchaeota archaeon]|nr:hypothetical protein [Candidatus Aenigmarchaeota archaeon]
MREEKLKPNYLMNELKSIRNELRRVSMLVENRVVGTESPSREEANAIKEFEKVRKERKLELIPLSKLK